MSRTTKGTKPTRRNVRSIPRRRHRVRLSRHNPKALSIHRRLVMFSDTADSSWLKTLSWFGSIALKLFALVVKVTDDLKAVSKTVSSGTVMLLGPGDFAAVSPFAVPVTGREDKEVLALRAFPFERASLRSVNVKIVPSADLGQRGGMYAALLMRTDPIDSQKLIDTPEQTACLLKKYSAKYDDIIKHPDAILSAVTKPVNFSMNVNSAPHNITAQYNSEHGFINVFPTCVLIVGFSDLAGTAAESENNYSPGKSLFEIHIRGTVNFHDPGELKADMKVTSLDQSSYSQKIFRSDSANINVSFFDHSYESEDGTLDLVKLPPSVSKRMLIHFDRLDLLPKLRLAYASAHLSDDFEFVEI